MQKSSKVFQKPSDKLINKRVLYKTYTIVLRQE